MREILFRGKLGGDGGWVEGQYAGTNSGMSLKVKHFICKVVGGIHHEVYPRTVGQYTGIKDKNGVKIFEGDTISGPLTVDGCTLPHCGDVKYVDSLGGFVSSNDSGDTLLSRLNTDRFEITGNIHDEAPQ
jgi:uncharacterized phage protein (TIGR01671 family)